MFLKKVNQCFSNVRSSIICMFPELKSLDFAKVTEDEKDSARLHIIVSKKGGKAAAAADHTKKYSL